MGNNCFKSENQESATRIYFTVYQHGIKTRVPSLMPVISNPLYKNRQKLSRAHDASALSNTAIENSTSVDTTTKVAKSVHTDDLLNNKCCS